MELSAAQTMRYEIKFSLDRAMHLETERWLAAKPFLRRAFPPRRINSIYFDNTSLTAAQDNFKGIANRKKFRVRWYGDSDQAEAASTLEVKVRNGRLGWKAAAPLSLSPAQLLRTGTRDIEKAFHADPAVRDLIPREAALVPVLYVGYRRHYHAAANGVRATLDENLSFADILSGNHAYESGRRAYAKSILEFKFAPVVKEQAAELMNDLPLYPTRSSKYVIGLSLFGHAVYI